MGLFGSSFGFLERAAATFILAYNSFIVSGRSPSPSSAVSYGFGAATGAASYGFGTDTGGLVIGTVSLMFSDALSSTEASGLTFGGLEN